MDGNHGILEYAFFKFVDSDCLMGDAAIFCLDRKNTQNSQKEAYKNN